MPVMGKDRRFMKKLHAASCQAVTDFKILVGSVGERFVEPSGLFQEIHFDADIARIEKTGWNRLTGWQAFKIEIKNPALVLEPLHER